MNRTGCGPNTLSFCGWTLSTPQEKTLAILLSKHADSEAARYSEIAQHSLETDNKTVIQETNLCKA